MAGVIVAVILFLVIWTFTRSDDGGAAVSEPPPEVGSGNLLLVGTGEEGNLIQLILAIAEEEGGHSLITIPARTIAEAPGQGFLRMDEIMAAGGAELLGQAVANLTRVGIDYYVTFDYAPLEQAAERTDVINLQAEGPLSTAGGEVTLVAGENLTSPDTAVSYLRLSSDDSRDGPQIQALFYRGLRDSLAQLADGDRQALARELAGQLESDLDEEELAGLIVSLTAAGQPFGVWPLPVSPAGGGDDWYFEPLPAQVEALILGSSLDSAITVEIQNGTETPGLVEAAASKLASLRYNISQNTELSGVNYDHTQVRCGSDVLADCERIQELLGGGTLIKDEYLEKQQIIIIIGRDMDPSAE